MSDEITELQRRVEQLETELNRRETINTREIWKLQQQLHDAQDALSDAHSEINTLREELTAWERGRYRYED